MFYFEAIGVEDDKESEITEEKPKFVNVIADMLDGLLENLKKINQHFENVFIERLTPQEALVDDFMGNIDSKDEGSRIVLSYFFDSNRR